MATKVDLTDKEIAMISAAIGAQVRSITVQKSRTKIALVMQALDKELADLRVLEARFAGRPG